MIILYKIFIIPLGGGTWDKRDIPAKNTSVLPIIIYGTIFVRRPNIAIKIIQSNEINNARFIPKNFFNSGNNNNIAEKINAKRKKGLTPIHILANKADKKKENKYIFLFSYLKDDFKSKATDIAALEAETALRFCKGPKKENRYKVDIAAIIDEFFLFSKEILELLNKTSLTNIKHAYEPKITKKTVIINQTCIVPKNAGRKNNNWVIKSLSKYSTVQDNSPSTSLWPAYINW